MSLKTKFEDTWQSSRLAQSVSNWYGNLSERDRKAVLIMLAFLGLFLLYAIILQPSINSVADATENLQTSREDLQWMYVNKERARQYSQQSTKVEKQTVENSKSLISLVDETAKAKVIPLDYIETDSQDRVKVSFSKIKFNQLVDWLYELNQQYDIYVSQINIQKSDPGIVTVTLHFKS